MAFRINPAKIAVWRDPNTLQIGLGASAPVFENLTASQERFIDLLYRGVANDSLDDQARELGVTNPHALIERLGPSMLASERIRNGRLSPDYLRGAFAEIIRASYLTSRDGLAVLEARSNKTVTIDNLGRGGLLIALGLAATGVGRILATDRGKVQETDLGPTGYGTIAIGKPRLVALRELLSLTPGSTVVDDPATLTPAKSRSAITVLVGTHVLHPKSYRQLGATPHLGVVFGETSVDVSPVVRNTPCLGCLEHWRSESDAAWPAIAGQLLGRLDYLEDSVSAMHAAASCIALILDELDGVNLDNLGARFNVATRTIDTWTWERHPACDCG